MDWIGISHHEYNNGALSKSKQKAVIKNLLKNLVDI